MSIEAVARLAIYALWLLWLGYWAAASHDVKRTRWREPVATRALHGFPLLACAALLLSGRWLPAPLTAHFAPVGPVLPVLGAAIVAAGLGLAIWARRHLGNNWSGWVTVKADHALIRSGPYRRVRHPIYSGLLSAFAGTALAIGEWRGLIAVAVAVIAFVLKLRIEERRMRETFPEYEGYRRQVAALIPGVF